MPTAAAAAPASRHLIYVADPMCSWCWGFSPVIGAIAERFQGHLPVRLIMGGLRAGNTRPMRPQDKDYIRGAWQRVHEASGQPFDFAFFEREGFVYDTEPSCRAVVSMRRLAPEKALAYLARVQRAFYAEGQDVTQAEVLAGLAPEFDIDVDAFHLAMLSPEARNETFRDFLICQESGIRGFPALLAGSQGEGYAVVTSGFQKLDSLTGSLEEWLASPAG